VIEVEFDYKIEEQAIAKIENQFHVKYAWHDLGINILADKDMRPAVFDFATTNGLKPFNSIKKKQI
jgi:ABC-2 type transport system ATP-binding protein